MTEDLRAKNQRLNTELDKVKKELEAAKATAGEQISEARGKAGEILEGAQQRHTQILDQAKDDATAERQRQVTAAEADITLATNQAREDLRASVASLAVLGASKILEKEVDAETHKELLDKLIAEI